MRGWKMSNTFVSLINISTYQVVPLFPLTLYVQTTWLAFEKTSGNADMKMAFLLCVYEHGHPCLLSGGMFCHNIHMNEAYHPYVTADEMKGLNYVRTFSCTEGIHEVSFHCVFSCEYPETTENFF
jgi:hypothetical protein